MSGHRFLACIAALLVVAVMGCRSDSEKLNSGAAGTTDTSTTSTSGTDTSGTTTTNSAASATTTGSTGGTVSNLSAQDKEFVMKAAMGGMAEVQMGQTAQAKAQSADVKAFGKRMVDDHSKASDELKQLVTVKGLAMPTETTQENKDAAQHLSSLSGKAFDKAYMDHMVEDHVKDVAEFQKASDSATDADIRNWAAKTLPTLQEHLRMARETAKKVR